MTDSQGTTLARGPGFPLQGCHATTAIPLPREMPRAVQPLQGEDNSMRSVRSPLQSH